MKISIVTAVYNSAATVADAITSVASQSHKDIEHLIVEGKSSDTSLKVIEGLQHDRMILSSEADKGIYDALNKGVQKATGDVVGFVHSDDFLAHDAVLERIAAAFADPGVEAVYGDLDYIDQQDTSRIIRHWTSQPFRPGLLKNGWMPPHPTLYLRREVYERIGGFDTSFRIAADFDFMLRYFSSATAGSVYLPEVLVKMRVGGESNKSLKKIMRKMREDYQALQNNRISPAPALAWKNLSKLPQFFVR